MSRPPEALLHDALESGRIHSAYLLAGPPGPARAAALAFARGLACRGQGPRPCEACADCRRSAAGETPPELDGAGKKGPLYRHLGDHPDLVWVERGAGDTRVRIGQVRALQSALRLRSHQGGRRAAVIADAEWLNLEAQNALLRLLEEPPEETTLILVATGASGLLATVRSRCQRVVWPPAPVGLAEDAPEAQRAWLERFAALGDAGVPEILDLAESFRGPRAETAPAVAQLLEAGSAWLHARTRATLSAGGGDARPELEAFATLAAARKALAQRNANPQMVAERALFALREAAAR
jgi:DNA polymerase III delta prime subunit